MKGDQVRKNAKHKSSATHGKKNSPSPKGGVITFSQRVVKCALSIPKGKVSTYGRIARAAGAGPMASQSITTILGKAYEAGETRIPFHRIVYADGKIWVSPKYRAERLKRYKEEKIELDENDRIKDFRDKLFEFK
jgi:methylated-DNA-protein-cysteine methyltransferase related protein